MKLMVIGLSALFLLSCGVKNDASHIQIKKASVINGVRVKDGEVIASSIVAIYDVKANYICTGSLIAPNVVLTAAHCKPDRISNLKVVFATDVDSVMNSLEPDVKAEYVLQATDFKAHSSYDPNNETIEVDVGDIALVKFKGAIPAGFKPATFLKDESLLKIGNTVTVAGFGVNYVDISKEINPKKVKDEDIEYGEVYCEDDMRGNHVKCFKVKMEGDGILRQGEAPISFIHQTEVRLNEKKAGTCSGDSGGPAYIKKDGELFLFGVTSRGSALCNEVGVYTNALYYIPWINDTMKILN